MKDSHAQYIQLIILLSVYLFLNLLLILFSYYWMYIGRSAVFILQDSARIVNENEGFVSIRVEVLNQRQLTSSVSVVLTPRIAPVDFTSPPDRQPFSRANTRVYSDNYSSVVSYNFIQILAGQISQ